MFHEIYPLDLLKIKKYRMSLWIPLMSLIEKPSRQYGNLRLLSDTSDMFWEEVPRQTYRLIESDNKEVVSL